VKADILALSCLMDFCRHGMKDVIEELKTQGLRDKVKVLVGGIATTQRFANEIGADAWSETCVGGTIIAKEMIRNK